ncbi:MAG: respiratory nitrate reductase subunit gamma [Flavobacteriales bacterium]|nr:respiratory nitrate reductase subunit gamma [Flavobacteriales bacterium]MBP9078654.1 respiratory nitrate reductase subunit gamma [Flavobacteriales bacterium]
MKLLEFNGLFSAGSLVTFLVGLTLVVLVVAIYMASRAKRLIRELHGVQRPSPTNFSLVLLLMLAAAGALVYLLKLGLEAQWGMLNTLVFVALPYVASAIFLIGSIHRYRSRGFQVSSLSSEFLERRKLFWGSQPFHWGLLVLFFGHLIAFLFPRTVLAWNGQPVRLLILEYSSFAFGLATLLGLVLLIRRRLGNKRVLIVSNRMDMLVYAVLITQIVSGLGVAFFARWGSSWFASSVTPYLRSLFALNPDIAAVSAMPWIIQVHIISAFAIVALIPFTRFMHFLVAPIDYLWRGYQLVIWNWGRRSIRSSGSYYPGVKSKNN